MNRLFTIILFSVFFLSSSIVQAQGNKSWTLLVYLDGSDLESGGGAGTNDIAEMLNAGNTTNVNVIVPVSKGQKEAFMTLMKDKGLFF